MRLYLFVQICYFYEDDRRDIYLYFEDFDRSIEISRLADGVFPILLGTTMGRKSAFCAGTPTASAPECR